MGRVRPPAAPGAGPAAASPYHTPTPPTPNHVQLHSLTAKTSAPLFGSRNGIAGGVRVDGAMPTGEGGQGGRARSLVEQPMAPREGALSALAAKAADLVAPLARVGVAAPPPPPPHEIPQEWIEVREAAGCWGVSVLLHWSPSLSSRWLGPCRRWLLHVLHACANAAAACACAP